MKTVAEFIEELKVLPQDAVLILAQDEEGNGFSPLYDASAGCYVPDTTYSGEFWEDSLDFEGGFSAVTLWPIN